MREPWLGDVRLEVGGRRHPERLQQPVPDDLPVLCAGDVRDHPPEDPVPQVRVLEGRARRPGEPGPGGEQLREAGEVEALLPVAPRVVGGQAAGHRQEVTDRHRQAIGGGRAPPGELRDVRRHRLVKAQPALVAEQEHRGGRERFRHRRDAVHGVRVRSPLLPVADRAGAAGVDQLPAHDHAPGNPRDAGLTLETVEAGVEVGEGGGEVWHPEMMPDGDGAGRVGDHARIGVARAPRR
ncbi:MAG: hypothetical protein A2V85_00305 [Chloroflexi bacterium RBG_16_72_14]|nr:MAG: hypothetical protein A2V85_00305 [Chloroflexi bacterium RBG_16_72_14]